MGNHFAAKILNKKPWPPQRQNWIKRANLPRSCLRPGYKAGAIDFRRPPPALRASDAKGLWLLLCFALRVKPLYAFDAAALCWIAVYRADGAVHAARIFCRNQHLNVKMLQLAKIFSSQFEKKIQTGFLPSLRAAIPPAAKYPQPVF